MEEIKLPYIYSHLDKNLKFLGNIQSLDDFKNQELKIKKSHGKESQKLLI